MNLVKQIVILILIFWLAGQLTASRSMNITVPNHVDLRGAAELSCTYDMGNDTLYSLKWYKDELEFYRYMPSYHPPLQAFDVDGISVNVSECNTTHIRLYPLHYNNTGAYKCEVSGDGPTFETMLKVKNMTVMVYPEEAALIDGIPQYFPIGEYITGNCTSSKSFPVANLTWYINDVKAKSWMLEDYSVITSPGPFYTKAVGLRFKVEQRHFKQPGGQLELKCKSIMGDTLQWERKVIVHPTTKSAAAAGYGGRGFVLNLRMVQEIALMVIYAHLMITMLL